MMKGRYGTIDAMRGFAALVVVIYHSTTLVSARCADGVTCEARFGYLAVDLFFAISGFVLAKAYDRRLDAGMGAMQFMRIRLERLLPIYLVGLAIGAALPVADALRGQGGGKHLVAEVFLNLGLLPSPSWGARPLPFALDPPAWSLFFELWVANVVFALGHRLIRGPALLGVILASLIALVFVQDHFGSLDVGSFWADFAGGFPRVLFSFFLGVLIYRGHERFQVPAIPAWAVLATVVATFWFPLNGLASRAFELAAVIAIYPTAILLGSRAVERRPAIGKAFGNWSYAIYAIHVPLLHLTIHFAAVSGLAQSPVLFAAYLLFVVITAAGLAELDSFLKPWRDRHAA